MGRLAGYGLPWDAIERYTPNEIQHILRGFAEAKTDAPVTEDER